MIHAKSRKELEELYFTFVLEIAKPEDFQTFLTKNSNMVFDSYLYKINKFFTDNYSKYLRQYTHSILSEKHSDLLEKFDIMFSPELRNEKLLEYINKGIISNKQIEIETKQAIRFIIPYQLNHIEKDSLFSIDLFFYLAIIQEILSINECSRNVARRILEYEFKDNSKCVFDKFIEVTSPLTQLILSKNVFISFDTFRNEVKNSAKYNDIKVLYIHLLFWVNQKIIIAQALTEIVNFNQIKGNNFNKNQINTTIIQIYLDFIDLLLKNEPKNEKENISLIIKNINKIINDVNDKIFFIRWLFKQIKAYSLSFDSFEDPKNELIKVIIMKEEYSLLTEMILYFTRFTVSLDNCYSSLKLLIPEINNKESSNVEIQKLKYSLYYFHLITKCNKIRNKFKIISNIQIHLKKDSLNNPFFCIYCVFLYLHSNIRPILEGNESFSKIFHLIENNKITDSFINIETFSKQNKSFKIETTKMCEILFKLKNLIYVNDNLNDFAHYSNGSNQFREIIKSIWEKKSSPYILFVRLPTNNPFFFNDDFISLHSNIQVQLENVNQICRYVFKGFYIVKENNAQNVLLFDKHSFSWYSVKNKKWMNNIDINSKLSEIYIVYFLRKAKSDEILSLIHNVSPINFHNEEEKTLYYSTLMNLYVINPKLFRKNNDFLIKTFKLTSNQNSQFFYNKIAKTNSLENNSESKQLFMFLFSQNKIKSNIQINNIKKLYDGNLIFEQINNYIKQNNVNENKINEIIFGLEFCWNNINILVNVPDNLIFTLALLYLISKSAQKDKSIYCNWIKSYFQEDSLKNFILLSSKINFNSKDLSHFEKYYNINPIKKEEENNSFRFNTQLLILFNKYEQNIEEPWNYLINIFNQHTYLFYNPTKTHKTYHRLTSLNLKNFYDYICQFQFHNEKDKDLLIKKIFHFELESYMQQKIPCLSLIKRLIIDDYIDILFKSISDTNLYPSKLENKLIRIYLIKSREYCKTLEKLLILEYFLDNFKITKEKKKIEFIKSGNDTQIFNIDMGELLPFILLHKEINSDMIKYLNHNDDKNLSNDIKQVDFFKKIFELHKISCQTIADFKYLEDFYEPNQILFIEIENQIPSLDVTPFRFGKNFFIKGIIIKTSTEKDVFLLNKYNKKWYWFNKDQWFYFFKNINLNQNQKVRYFFVYFNAKPKEEYENKLFEIFYEPKIKTKNDFYKHIIKWYEENHYFFYNQHKDYFSKLKK